MIDLPSLWFGPVVALCATILSAILCRVLMPLLQRYALARPNGRSSHTLPTPQGGGIAIMIAACAAAIVMAWPLPAAFASVVPALIAAVILAVIGLIDDISPIPVIPRLLLQGAVVIALLVTQPSLAGALPFLPVWLAIAVLALALLWFVNLTNFMDGLDWITLAEALPVAAAIAALGALGETSAVSAVVAFALLGALIGFAPFNKPVARLFLGDVGSLPIGLLLGWCLIELATRHPIAALLLPLYYLADATLTLFMRLIRRENFWEAHRSHFYQRATVNGFSVMAVVGHVFILNLVLVALATFSVFGSHILDVACLAAGSLAVAFVLRRFSMQRR